MCITRQKDVRSDVEHTGKRQAKRDEMQGQLTRAAGEQGTDKYTFCNIRQ